MLLKNYFGYFISHISMISNQYYIILSQELNPSGLVFYDRNNYFKLLDKISFF